MNRCLLIAAISFIIGGLLATLLTYELGRCKVNEIVFKEQTLSTATNK